MKERANSSVSSTSKTESVEKELRWFVPISLMLIFIAQTLYMNVSAFFPLYAKTHFNMNKALISFILGSFMLTILIAFPLVVSFFDRFGRKNLMAIGFAVTAVATAGFGLLVYVTNFTAFTILAVVLRVLQGLADTFIMGSTYTMLPLFYPKRA